MNTLRLNEGVLQGNDNDNDNEIQEQDPEEVAEILQCVRIVQGQANSNQWIAQYLGGGQAVVGPSPISVAQTIYEQGRPDQNNFSQRLQNWMNILRLNEGVL
jgi:hypothetical protein